MTQPPPSDPAAGAHAAELRRALRELVRRSGLRDRVRAGAHGLTASGAHALEVLTEGGPLSLNALAAGLFVDKSTASRTVGLLEDRALVVRLPDPADGRSIRVELTAGGREVERQLRDASVREAGTTLDGLPPATRESGLAFLRHLARPSADDGAMDRRRDREKDA